MKKCLHCTHEFSAVEWICPVCGFNPVTLQGVAAFSPEKAHGNEGFDEKFYDEMFDLEATNFWFRARSRLVNWTLGKNFPNAGTYLEIGCGTGYMLAQVEMQFPDLLLNGSEVLIGGLAYAKRRVKKATLLQLDARTLPFRDEFDVIGAFDVIEHIEEDGQVLGEMFGALRSGGGIVLTVPQHRWLWSYADDYAHHKRRYTAEELMQKVKAAGFTEIKMTSFMSLLLPLMYIARVRKRTPQQDYDDTAELRINGVVNFVLGCVMDMERLLIKCGIHLAAGGSLLLVARKP